MLERKVEVEGDGGGGEFVCIATFLPVRKWRHVIPFLMMSARVQKQLLHTRGLARYSVRANLLRKRFWTLTIWQKKVFVNGFVNAEPHSDAVRKFGGWAGEGAAFVEWTSINGSIDWKSAMRKLQNPTFYYKEPGG